MKLNKITADMVSRRPDQTAEWLNRLARQVDIVETDLGSMSKKPWDLPIATTYSLGVIKVGQNLSITPDGVLSALAPASYDYTLLFNKPKINSVELVGDKSLSDIGIGDATIKIQKNSTDVGSFTTNSTTNTTIDISVPTKTSDLTNDGEDGISPFVDATSLASDLALKQDKLIAGSNIQIAADGKTISATDTTYSAGNGLSLNGTTFSVDTNVIATQADITALDNAKQDNLTQAQLNAVNSGIDATKVAQIATNTGNITSVTNRVTTIEEKIPSTATSSNKLTDKDYVDNAVATNSANYISDNGQPFQSLADLQAYSGPLTNNDYAFVVSTDAQGNTIYTRYKYNASTQTWAEEYSISNPTFSSTQWAAIDSGVTANDVAQITTNKNDIASLQSGKQDKLTTAQQAAVDSGIDSTKVQQIATNATNITNLQNNKQDKLSQAQLDAVNSGITAAKVTKLDGIEAGAEVNVQSDWNEANSSSDAYIKNKPTIGDATLTIKRNGSTAQTFTANSSTDKNVDIQAPVRVNLRGQVQGSSWRRSVIALCRVTTTDRVEMDSFSSGKITFHRDNGLAGIAYIDVYIENAYYGAYAFNFSYTSNVNLLSETAAIDTATGFRPCVFKKNDVWYAGVEVYLAAAQYSQVVFDGETNFNIFGVDYYRVQYTSSGTTYPAEVLDQEVYDSIDYTKVTYLKDAIMAKSFRTEDGTIKKPGYTATLPNKNGTVAMTSDINNATLKIQKNGTDVASFTANSSTGVTANITVPTKTSDITNDGADGTSTYVENDDLTTALAGKQDVLTAGTNINITSNTISTQTRGIEYIVGTQASATNLWTGVSTDNGCSNGTVYVGKTIAYYLSQAGNNSAATLNLTLPDGTTTGGIPVRRTVSGTITTHFSAGNVIIFTYDGTYWKMSAYYDSNDNYNTRLYNASIKAAAAITSGRLCIGTSSGYKMIASGVESDITYPILYAGSNVSVGSTSDNFYTIIRSINLQNTKSGWTGVATQEVWLVGTLSGATFTVDSSVFTQTIPTTEDGKTYTPIGITYNTNAIFFCPSNIYWQYKNGEFRPISHTSAVMTGADASTAGTAGLVPAPAAGDNTKYLSGDGTWKTVSQYNLPIASASELGGVKIGSRLTINSSTGVLSADSQTDNNFTTTLKNKLDGIAAGAEVNVQANWTEANSSSDAYIKNKPSLATVATSGSYNDLTNKPTIPAAQVNSDWNANSGVAQILNKPSLATVATSGSYNDLTNKPTIPTVNNATLTIQKNGTNVQTFTANQSTNATANIAVPTKTSDITNDSGFITSSGTVAKADQLTTARTIAIGTGATGTATSFNGTSNITIPITDVKDAYVTWGGKNLVSNLSPDDMGCVDEFGHNKLAFLPAECIQADYSTDGGATWIDYGLTDAQKIAMVTTIGTQVLVGKNTEPTAENIANLKARVRIACGPTTGGSKLYTALKKVLVNVNTNGAGGSKVTVRTRTIGNYSAGVETWVTYGTYDVAGGSGWNSLPIATTFGGSFTSQLSQIGQIEFEFFCSSVGTWGTKKLGAVDFRFIGMNNWAMPSEMARAGHLYTVDIYQNAFFPNAVLPKTDSAYNLGNSSNKWKNLYLSGGIYHGSSFLTLPSTAGTLALTSDIPTVPTKTSDLTNDGEDGTGAYIEDFLVTVSSYNYSAGTFTADKTFEQVKAAFDAGKNLKLKFTKDGGEQYIPLSRTFESAGIYYIVFEYGQTDSTGSVDNIVSGLYNDDEYFIFIRNGSSAPYTYEYIYQAYSNSMEVINSLSVRPISVSGVPNGQTVYDELAGKANLTTAQNFAVQEGSTNPVFDDMTPVQTFEWDVSDTVYRAIYQIDNTGWDYANMDITVAYRITVTGTNIKSVTDVIDRWHNPTSYPLTSALHRTLSTSAATTGFRYLRAVYPTASYLNNATYPIGQEIYMYNSTARHVLIEVFKTSDDVTWNTTKPTASIYKNSSTYQGTSSMDIYATRGWHFRKSANFTANNSDAASSVSDFERYSPGISALKSGATALVAGHFAFLAEDGLVYDISNTAKAISVGSSKIGQIASGINANTAINQSYWKTISRPNATQYGYFGHDTMALGDRVYLRCTMDSNGKIYSDNYLAKSMSPGYTWMPMGFMTAATTFYADTRFPKFYTLDADGNMTHMDGIPLISYANGNSISY